MATKNSHERPNYDGPTKSDNLGTPPPIVEEGKRLPVKTKFDQQLVDQDDNNDPSFEDRGNLVDDSELYNSPNLWEDLFSIILPYPSTTKENPKVEIKVTVRTKDMKNNPYELFEKVVIRSVTCGDKSHEQFEFYGKGNKGSTPDSVVVTKSDVLPVGRLQ